MYINSFQKVYMQIILLSGGSGKRLWPLSNNTRSKQFIKLLTAPDGSKESMVQRWYGNYGKPASVIRLPWQQASRSGTSSSTSLGKKFL